MIFGPVEAGAAQPVLPGQLDRVTHAHAPLLGRIDHEQPAERPERLPAEALLRLLVEQQHPLAGVGELGRGHQPRQPRTDNDHIRVHDHHPMNRPANTSATCG
jgi:hypothetical protein